MKGDKVKERQELVLVPGLLCTETVFSGQIPGLSSGADITIADSTAHDSIAAMAGAIIATATAPFALAGFSMGGYVALEVVRRAPEMVRRLALVATTAHPDDASKSARRRDFMAIARRGRFRGMTRGLLPLYLHPQSLKNERLCETIIAMSQSFGAETFIAQQQAILGRDDARDWLAAITCPTLIIAGADDPFMPLAEQQYMAREIGDAHLAVVAGSGHMVPLEQPAEVCALMEEWLEPA